jgi:phage antirepressor YoqD-like protein
LEALVSHAGVPENTMTLEENVAIARAYTRSEAAATMRELYAELRIDEDFVERACIQKACRGLSSTQISAVQARLREGEEVPVRSAFTIEAWERVSTRERGERIEVEEDTMNDRAAEKTMTVREVAEALGMSTDTIYNSAKELFPQLFKNGKAAYLSEEQVTAVKMNLRKNSEVSAQPKTRLEKALLIRQAIQFQDELIADLRQENESLQAENDVLKPKAEYHDRLVDAALATSFRDTAKELGVPERQFIETLIRKGYIYRDTHGSLKPYHNRMSYFTVKDWEHEGAAGTQTRVTVAGKAHFLSLFGRVVADKPLFS